MLLAQNASHHSFLTSLCANSVQLLSFFLYIQYVEVHKITLCSSAVELIGSNSPAILMKKLVLKPRIFMRLVLTNTAF